MNEIKDNVNLSVIMPALNEEANIGSAVSSALEAMNHFGINGEIVVIDDGSTDKTASVIEEKMLKYPQKIRIIRHIRAQGIGASFWDGVKQAKGDVVVMLPGDNENDPYETLRYYGLFEHVDIVVPFVYNKEVRPGIRNMLSQLYLFIINETFAVNFNYTNGTVLYRKSVVNELNCSCNGFFFQTDILIRAVKKGYLFAEVPYKLGVRNKGVSKAVSFSSLLQIVRGYLKLAGDIIFKRDSGGSFAEDTATYRRKIITKSQDKITNDQDTNTKQISNHKFK